MSSSNIFQILFIIGSTFLFVIPEYLNNSWWCFSSSFSDFEDRRRVFPPSLIRSLKDLCFPLCIRSRSFEVVISFKPFNSTGATSLFNHFNGVSFEWSLTHRSFPRILPDSSYSPRASLNSFEVWRKNELSSVECLSPRSVKFFPSLAQPFHSSFRSA